MTVRTWVAYDKITRKCSGCGRSIRLDPLLALQFGTSRQFICKDCLGPFVVQIVEGVNDVRGKLD